MKCKAIIARVGDVFSLETLQEAARQNSEYTLEGNHLCKMIDIPDEVLEENKWEVSMECLFKDDGHS